MTPESADTVDERNAAGALDRLRHCPARAHVVEDLRARCLLENRFGEEGRDEVAWNELTRVVDEEAAIRVPVEGNAQVGPFRSDLLDDELAIFRKQRVGLVVRERSVRLEEVRHRLDRQAFEDRRKHDSAHAVRRVDHDAQGLHRFDVDEGQDGVDPPRPDVFFADMCWGLTPGRVVNGHGPRADVQ